MIRCKTIGLLVWFGVLFRPVPPENNPRKEAVKALEQARAVESQRILQAEQRQRMLEAMEK